MPRPKPETADTAKEIPQVTGPLPPSVTKITWRRAIRHISATLHSGTFYLRRVWRWLPRQPVLGSSAVILIATDLSDLERLMPVKQSVAKVWF